MTSPQLSKSRGLSVSNIQNATCAFVKKIYIYMYQAASQVTVIYEKNKLASRLHFTQVNCLTIKSLEMKCSFYEHFSTV